MNGADGETYKQMLTALGFSGIDQRNINRYMQTMQAALADVDNTVIFSNANSIWLRKTLAFLPEFKQTSQTYFHALLKEEEAFDDRTAEAINRWCREETHGMIPKFIEPEEIGATQALLLNVLYFNGKWKKPFNASETERRLFFRADGSTASVPMMQKKKEIMYAASTDEAVIVSLPYGNGAFNIQFIQPADLNVRIDDLLGSLTAEKWSDWMKKEQKYFVNLLLPKFDIDSEHKQIESIMRELGAVDAFSGKADFSKMCKTKMPIGQIKQRSTIHLDEKGTEVSAITSVSIDILDLPSYPELDVLFNRPFAFFITEVSTHAILFAGKVGDPIVK